MVARARLNAKKDNLRPPRVAFVQAQLTEPFPIVSDSIDCVLSNCVINLLPGSRKASLLKEIYRVLRPGGRLVLDDVRAQCLKNASGLSFLRTTIDHRKAAAPRIYPQRFGFLCQLHLWRYTGR